MTRKPWKKMLRIIGVTLIVMLPLVLAVWFARLRAESDTQQHLHAFASMVLEKTETVIRHVETVREEARRFRGEVCSRDHQVSMLNSIRSSMDVEELIYARDDDFLCSSFLRPALPYYMGPPDYLRDEDVAIYYYRDTPFFAGHSMVYMRKGNYVAVVNPLSFGEVMTDDKSLEWGIYDTRSDHFFSMSNGASEATLKPMIRHRESSFQQDDRVYNITLPGARPIAVIVSTSASHLYAAWYHQLTLTLPLGAICSMLILMMWSRTRQQLNSPRRMMLNAIKKKQFHLHYQPIVDIKHGRCVGAEALLRWHGYNGPLMSPAVFIPLAEREGLISRLTEYVIDYVFEDLGNFLARTPEIYISINLSATDFHSPYLIDWITDKVHRYGVKARQIKIEVTERGFIDVAKTTPVIQAFRAAGFEVAIDDFGTGYSNLQNLYALNVDILKIDKSFIDTLPGQNTSHLIAEHIIDMAHSLQLKTIAEGVENSEQVCWLLKRGVQFCQGWYFAKALPGDEFQNWLARKTPPPGKPHWVF